MQNSEEPHVAHNSYAGQLFRCHLFSGQESHTRKLGLMIKQHMTQAILRYKQLSLVFSSSFILMSIFQSGKVSSYMTTCKYIQETNIDLNFHAEMEGVYILNRTQPKQWYKYALQIIHYLAFFFSHKTPYKLKFFIEAHT